MRLSLSLKLLLLFMTGITPDRIKAQNGFDLLHDFCTDPAISSVIFSSYADSSFYFVNGATSTQGLSPEHGFLACFDYTGQPLWTKKLLFPGTYNSASSYKGIVKIAPDRYVMTGTITDKQINPNFEVWHPYFYIFNSKGDSILYKSYPDSNKTRYFTSLIFSNGHLVTTGIISNNDHSKYRLWISKYDTFGNMLWERSYMENTAVPYNCKIVPSADGQYYQVAGDMMDTTINHGSSCLVRTDTSGKLQWVRSLLKKYVSFNDIDIVSNPTSGYYFVSSYSIAPDDHGDPVDSHIYFGKLNENGDTLWTKTHNACFLFATGRQIAWSADKQHLVITAGAKGDYRTGLIKTDTLGNILWSRKPERIISPDKWFYVQQGVHSLSVTPDDHYLLTGYIKGGPIPGVYDTAGIISWMMLTNSNGERYSNDSSLCSTLTVRNITPANDNVSIYPNPVQNQLTIENIENKEVVVTDIFGRWVHQLKSSVHRIQINTQSWPPGNYIIQIRDHNGNIEIRKIAKQ